MGRTHRIHRQRGLTLVEVLVAIVVLAIGLLGLAGLQVNAIKVNQSSTFRWRASQLAADLVDQMRADKADLVTGSCSIDATGTLSGTCPTGWLAGTTGGLPTWGQLQLPALPGAIVAFGPAAGGSGWEIDVSWDDSRASQSTTPSNVTAPAGSLALAQTCGAVQKQQTGCFKVITNI